MKSSGTTSTTQAASLKQAGVLAVLRPLLLALTGLVFCLIALGGLVRNAGAGLSCPDWPLCFGRFVPPMDVQVFLEWFHRLIAGSVSTLLVVASALLSSRRDLRRRFGANVGVSLGLLGLQIVLGGLTVLGLLSPKWVSSHLAVGQAFFGSILWLTLGVRDYGRDRAAEQSGGRESLLAYLESHASRAARAVRVLAPLAAAALFGQIILGGLVSSNYAGLACLDFPTCNGQWVPPLEGLVLFQFLHRCGAVVTTLAIAALCVAGSTGAARVPPRARAALTALPFLLAIQIFLGIGSVLFKLPLPMSVAHLGTAAALFGTLLVTTYEVRSSRG